MKAFSKGMLEFREARIVCGNKGAGVVMGGLEGPDGMRIEVMGNLFGFEGGGIISGEEGLGKVDDVGVDVIRVAVDGQRQGDEVLGE